MSGDVAREIVGVVNFNRCGGFIVGLKLAEVVPFAVVVGSHEEEVAMRDAFHHIVPIVLTYHCTRTTIQTTNSPITPLFGARICVRKRLKILSQRKQPHRFIARSRHGFINFELFVQYSLIFGALVLRTGGH